MPFQNRLRIGGVVLVKSPLKITQFFVLGIVTEVINVECGIVRSVNVKQCGSAVQVHSLTYLFPLELPLSFEREDQVRAMSLSTDVRSNFLKPRGRGGGLALSGVQCSARLSSNCDRFENCLLFGCVGIGSHSPLR